MTIAAKPDPAKALVERRKSKTASSLKSRAKDKRAAKTGSPGGDGPKEGASITEVISTALVKAGENGAKNILQSEATRIGLVVVEKDKFEAMAKTPDTLMVVVVVVA